MRNLVAGILILLSFIACSGGSDKYLLSAGDMKEDIKYLSLIHISEPTRP